MSTWIFLRGLMRETRHWGEFPQVFRQHIPQAQIVMLDLPGNGRLHRLETPAGVEDMMEHCRAQLASLGIAPPYYLLGLSLGAMAVVSWATHHHEELSGCVLINTSLRPFNSFYRRLQPRNYFKILKLLLMAHTSRDWEQSTLQLTSRHLDRTSKVLDDWIVYRDEYPVARRNALRQLLAAARYRAPSVNPLPHALILASVRDDLVDVHCSRTLASAWGLNIAEHPTAGHDIPLDDGEWVARQVQNWLSTDHVVSA